MERIEDTALHRFLLMSLFKERRKGEWVCTHHSTNQFLKNQKENKFKQNIKFYIKMSSSVLPILCKWQEIYTKN
jgi:hypothetical protein